MGFDRVSWTDLDRVVGLQAKSLSTECSSREMGEESGIGLGRAMRVPNVELGLGLSW